MMQEKIQEFIDNAPLAYQSLDEQGKVIEVNQPWLKMLGLKGEDVIGKSFSDFLTDQSKEMFEKRFFEFKAKGETKGADFTMVRADSSLVFVEIDGKVTKDEKGDFIKTHCVLKDVTEQKRKDAALRESEKRYRMVVENSLDVIYSYSPEGTITYVSPQATVYGYSPSEVIGHHILEFVHPDDQEEVIKSFEETLLKGREFSITLRLKKKDGSFVYVEENAKVLRRDGNIIELIGSIRDISERKESEKEVKNLAKFPSENPNPVLRITKDGKVLYSNKAGKSVLDQWGSELGGDVPEPWRNLIDDVFKSNKKKEEDQEIKDRSFSFVISPVLEAGYVNLYGRDITERKKAEEALRQYGHIVSSSQDMLALLDKNFLYLAVNDSYSNAFNINRDKLIDHSATEIFGKEFFEKVIKPKAEKCLSGEEVSYEEWFDFPAAGKKYMEVNYYPHKNENNEIVGFVVNGRDITERKKAREESENIFKLSPDMICVCTPEGKFIKVNPAFEKVLGYTTDEVLKLGWAKLVHPDDVGATNKKVQGQLKGDPIINFANRFKCKDGTYKTLEWQATPSLEGSVYATARDITERKKTEEKVRENEEKYRNLFESESDAIMIFDAETLQFEEINSAGISLYGYSREEFLKLKVDDISAEKERTILSVERIKESEDTSSVVIERVMQKKDGTTFQAEITTGKFISKGRMKILGAVRDITQRKAINSKLIKYQSQLKSLASELSLAEEKERRRIGADIHDHVSQILAFAKIKLGILLETATAVESTQAVKEVINYIEEALDYTRSLVFELSPPVLYDFGIKAGLEWLAEYSKSKYDLKVKLKGPGENIHLSEQIRVTLFKAVREVLMNITKHARVDQAWITCRFKEDSYEVEIEDKGVGFEFQNINPVKGEIKGFGLFNIRERIGYLGGSIDIESEPDKGTKVIIKVPFKSTKY